MAKEEIQAAPPEKPVVPPTACPACASTDYETTTYGYALTKKSVLLAHCNGCGAAFWVKRK